MSDQLSWDTLYFFISYFRIYFVIILHQAYDSRYEEGSRLKVNLSR